MQSSVTLAYYSGVFWCVYNSRFSTSIIENRCAASCWKIFFSDTLCEGWNLLLSPRRPSHRIFLLLLPSRSRHPTPRILTSGGDFRRRHHRAPFPPKALHDIPARPDRGRSHSDHHGGDAHCPAPRPHVDSRRTRTTLNRRSERPPSQQPTTDPTSSPDLLNQPANQPAKPTSQPTNQTSQLTKQPDNRPANKPTSRPKHQQVHHDRSHLKPKQPTNQPANQPTNQPN